MVYKFPTPKLEQVITVDTSEKECNLLSNTHQTKCSFFCGTSVQVRRPCSSTALWRPKLSDFLQKLQTTSNIINHISRPCPIETVGLAIEQEYTEYHGNVSWMQLTQNSHDCPWIYIKFRDKEKFKSTENENKKENVTIQNSKNSLGAICVLPASMVMWVGIFKDFALPCIKKVNLDTLSKKHKGRVKKIQVLIFTKKHGGVPTKSNQSNPFHVSGNSQQVFIFVFNKNWSKRFL